MILHLCFRYVQAIETRRLEALARREAMRAGAAQNHSRGRSVQHAAVTKRRSRALGLVLRLSVWTLVGALGAIAYGVYRSNGVLDWRGWWRLGA